MQPTIRSFTLALAALTGGLLVAAPAGATVLGSKPETACYGVWEGVELTANRDVDCVDGDACDGDGAVDGKCVLGLQACVNAKDVDGCTPLALTTFKMTKALERQKKFVTTPLGIPADLSAPTEESPPSCGTAGLIELPLKKNGTKPSKRFTVKMNTKADAAGPLEKGVNKIRMRCVPNTTPPVCADRGAGVPKQLSFAVPNFGTDLDNGWKGASHNFPVVEGAELNFCLDGCDASTDPTCDASGSVGANSLNGETFGPPLPLLAAGVPVCIVNEFADTITATYDLETGDLAGNVGLNSTVYLSSATEVCPRCVSSGGLGSTGTCSGGRAPGRSCTVDGQVRVENASGNKDYTLSRSCLPSLGRAGTIDIGLPITTGTSQLDGSIPCPRSGGAGIAPQDDACGAGTCTATCTGDACVEVRDGQCIDIKGGISQVCCSSQTDLPCFPSGVAPNVIARDGLAVQAEPAWPDPTYPKTASDSVLAATFCEGSTGSAQVDIVTGLPGPGALLLTGQVEVTAGE
jgi:hypothetical protein